MENDSLYLEWVFFLAKIALLPSVTEPVLLNDPVLIQDFCKRAAEK